MNLKTAKRLRRQARAMTTKSPWRAYVRAAHMGSLRVELARNCGRWVYHQLKAAS